MKKIMITASVIFLLIIVIPSAITFLYILKKSDDQQIYIDKDIVDKRKLYITENNKEVEIDIEDYIKGVVSSEMPALFNEEALKAQAVASRTYLIKHMGEKTNVNDISQAYLKIEDLKKNWGENFTNYYNRISFAVDSTKGEIMLYENEPIEAVFHSTSGGFTENSVDVWKKELPYLQSVDSSFDENAPDFTFVKKFTKNELKEILKNKYNDIELSENNLFNEIKIVDRTESGYVKTISIGNKTFEGNEIRVFLKLRSTNFIIDEDGEDILFTTKGYGHGAGMSQYGANFMGEQGSTYKEILNHYYKGVSIGVLK